MTQWVPWQSAARGAIQRFGIEPRNFRRLRWLHKAHVLRSYRASLSHNLRFVLLDPEPHNFTYEISNARDLAGWVADVSGTDVDAANRLICEPGADRALADRLRGATRGRWLWTKGEPPFGKRLGWYALVRTLRPRLVIETGVHDGLGSMLILRALELNVEDGHAGRLISFDVNPAAGWLVGSHPLWDFHCGSSQEVLPRVLAGGRSVDMSIYDGWHSYEHERAELELIARHLAQHGVLLSDDAQVTSALADVCREHDFEHAAVYLRPVDHFHPGTVLAAGRPRIATGARVATGARAERL